MPTIACGSPGTLKFASPLTIALLTSLKHLREAIHDSKLHDGTILKDLPERITSVLFGYQTLVYRYYARLT